MSITIDHVPRATAQSHPMTNTTDSAHESSSGSCSWNGRGVVSQARNVSVASSDSDDEATSPVRVLPDSKCQWCVQWCVWTQLALLTCVSIACFTGMQALVWSEHIALSVRAIQQGPSGANSKLNDALVNLPNSSAFIAYISALAGFVMYLGAWLIANA